MRQVGKDRQAGFGGTDGLMDVVSINAFLPIRVSLITFCCYNVLQYVCSKSTLLFGTFVNLRKSTLSFVTSVCPPDHQSFCPRGQLGSQWMDFHKFHFEYFSKLCPETSRFSKVEQGQRVLYVKPNLQF